MDNEIHLYGTVGASWWDEDYFTARTVREALSKITGDVTVRINSGGGVATEGQAIYTMLVDHPGKVTVVVDGVAASAASLIAMAGDEIVMRLGAWMLIHDPASPWTEGRGTEADHQKEAEILGTISNAYADIYAARSGLTREEARAVMRAETVLDGAAAVEMGFATSYDGATQAAAAARFDYRIYAHAPADLRAASKGLGRTPGKAAVMAMIAGRPRTKREEPKLADEEDKAKAIAGADDEDQAEQTGGTEDKAAGDPGAVAAARRAEQGRTMRIMNMATMAGRDMEFASHHIAAGTSSDAVMDLIMKDRQDAEGDKPMHGRETARITRDERTTRREAMGAAITAQLNRTDPKTDAARPFMAMPLYEMAAICADHKGPVRSWADREAILMAAAHSTSDFPGIFENALNKSLMERYQVAERSYRQIARRRDFKDFRPHPMVRSGDFPRLQPIGEDGEIKFGTFGEKRETAQLAPYAVGVGISRQMMINDDLGAIDDMLGDWGSGIADFEEQNFYSFLSTATLSSDGLAVWEAGTHKNLAGIGTAITVASLATGKAAMRKQMSINGLALNLVPKILLVGPDKEVEALQLVTSITPAQAGNVNPFSGKLDVVVSAQITGNTWYLFADPGSAGGACFVYGYLDGFTGPRLRTNEPFGTQGWQATLEHDFGTGARDFRGTYKNPGA